MCLPTEAVSYLWFTKATQSINWVFTHCEQKTHLRQPLWLTITQSHTHILGLWFPLRVTGNCPCSDSRSQCTHRHWVCGDVTASRVTVGSSLSTVVVDIVATLRINMSSLNFTASKEQLYLLVDAPVSLCNYFIHSMMSKFMFVEIPS